MQEKFKIYKTWSVRYFRYEQIQFEHMTPIRDDNVKKLKPIVENLWLNIIVLNTTCVVLK